MIIYHKCHTVVIVATVAYESLLKARRTMLTVLMVTQRLIIITAWSS